MGNKLTAAEQKPPTPDSGAIVDAETPSFTGPLATLMDYCKNPDTKRRMSEMLGKRSGSFLNSIINVVKNNPTLMKMAKVNPGSIMSSAMIAASLNLPIDPSLGFAAIVPYEGKNPSAQFQLMYRGLIQLAQRSGQYKTMNDAVVYKDELESYNPITGDIVFTPQDTWKIRYNEELEEGDVAGFYFRFTLLNGFDMARFITYKEAMAHGRRYSKAFQNDIKYKSKRSLWSTDPLPMGLKTIIKMTLSKYGILSIEMQDALVADNVDFADPREVDAIVVEGKERSAFKFLQRGEQPQAQNDVPVDAEAVGQESEPESTTGQAPAENTPATDGENDTPGDGATEGAEAGATEFDGPQPGVQRPDGDWRCLNCGHVFWYKDAPVTNKGKEQWVWCTNCKNADQTEPLPNWDKKKKKA